MLSLRRTSTLSLLIALPLTACTTDKPSNSSETSTTGENSTSGNITSTESGSGESESESETGEQPACPAQTPAELMDCVEQSRYEADIQLVDDVRTPGSPHWQAVQDLCFERLTELGYSVERQNYGTGINVVGMRPGTDKPDEHVLVGGHYDHIPDCSGADDNATGIAATLEVARILADIPTSRTLVIVCWDEEELGLIGSAAHAQAALDSGEQLTAVFSLDSIGAASSEPNSQVVPAGFDLLFPTQYAELEANEFRADFLLWVSDDTMGPLGEALDGFADSIGLRTLGSPLDDALKTSPALADLRRSDHASYWDRDIPAMFFNDTGEFRYSGYHCGEGDDTFDRLNLEFGVNVAKVAVATTGVALGM